MNWFQSIFRGRTPAPATRPPPRNPLPCTYTGERPVDGYSGNEDIWREWTALARPYAGKYRLDGWIVDGTPDLPDDHLRAIVTQLNDWKNAGTLNDEVTGIMLAQAADTEAS